MRELKQVRDLLWTLFMNSTSRLAFIDLRLVSASRKTLIFTNTGFELLEHSKRNKGPNLSHFLQGAHSSPEPN